MDLRNRNSVLTTHPFNSEVVFINLKLSTKNGQIKYLAYVTKHMKTALGMDDPYTKEESISMYNHSSISRYIAIFY